MASTTQSLQTIIGISTYSVDDAIDRALVVARVKYGEPDWFEVSKTHGFNNNGRVSHYQVSLELGYVTPDQPSQPDQYLDPALSTCRNTYVSPVIERRF
jgi:dodecin